MKITFEVSDETAKEINELCELHGFDKYAELFNNSLTLFEEATRESKNGKRIAMIEENGAYTIVNVPCLDKLRNEYKPKKASLEVIKGGKK